MPDTLSLRDQLALDRTHLANIRTLLAFARTGIYFIFTGAGIFYLIKKPGLFWLGWIAVLLGFCIILIGLVNYLRTKQRVGRLYN